MTLKRKLAGRTPLVGTFVKIPAPAIIEVLGVSGLDLVCLDAEHAPFDRRDIDTCLLAAKARNIPCIVRVPALAAEHVGHALDCGADGILVPHVADQATALKAVGSARFGAGRGYSGTTRAAGYGGLSMAEHKAASNRDAVVVAQIEDAAALDRLDTIFAVDDVDAFFVGSADLAISMGHDDASAPAVIAAIERICEHGCRAGRVLGLFIADIGDIGHWHKRGVTLFLLGSDQGFMRSGAERMLETVRPPLERD